MIPRNTLTAMLRPLTLLALLALAMSCGSTRSSFETSSQPIVSGTLHEYVQARVAEADAISAERRARIDQLAEEVVAALDAGDAQLNFICTHNSRRSQLAQVWARVAADHVGVEGVTTFSGGTEETAFNPRAVAALRRAGLEIQGDSELANPVYRVAGWGGHEPLECRSKRFADPSNPQSGFIAVMTCSDADESCPFVPGAARRVALTYVDPKAFDGTDREAEAYDERCGQIAREMLYLFRRVADAG